MLHDQIDKTERPVLRIAGTAWRMWKKFAELLGNAVMLVWLTALFWVFVPIIALPYRKFADPLSFRTASRGRWINRTSIPSDVLEWMRRQG